MTASERSFRTTAAGTSARSQGATIEVKGAWTIFRDLGVRDTNPDRTPLPNKPRLFRPDGFEVEGSNTKFINLVIHDIEEALGFWNGGVNSEIYGSILYVGAAV